MGDDKSLRNEEQEYGEEPKNHVKRAGFYSGAEKIGNNHKEDRGENQVQETEFLTKRGTLRFKACFGCSKLRAYASGQCAGGPQDFRRAMRAEIVGVSVPRSGIRSNSIRSRAVLPKQKKGDKEYLGGLDCARACASQKRGKQPLAQAHETPEGEGKRERK